MCNDPEERQHLKHILLNSNMVLGFENNNRRFFARHSKVPEIEKFRYERKAELSLRKKSNFHNEEHHSETREKMR